MAGKVPSICCIGYIGKHVRVVSRVMGLHLGEQSAFKRSTMS